LFADIHHADHHWRKNIRGFERRGDGLAFFHTFMNICDRFANNHIP